MPEKQKVRVGMPACFCGLRCTVRRVQADHSLCLELDKKGEDVALPPLFTQDICWLQTEEGLLRCVGEVAERYHSENACRIRMEIKSGLYEVNTHMVAVHNCRIDGALIMEGMRELPVVVTEISGEEAWLQPKDTSFACGDADREAQLLLENMALEGMLSAAEDEDRPDAPMYVLRFREMEMSAWQKLMETVVFPQKQKKNLSE